MVFIETPIFMADVRERLSDEEYARLQEYPDRQPDAGYVVSGTCGLRKINAGW